MIFGGLSLTLFVLLIVLFLVIFSSLSLYSSFEYNFSNSSFVPTVYTLKW